jgi:hypothetical protein
MHAFPHTGVDAARNECVRHIKKMSMGSRRMDLIR